MASASAISSNARRSAERPLDGRVALVTGAARGLGQAFATALAGAGAAVAGVDVDALDDTGRSIDGLGGTFVRLQADVTDPDGLVRACAAAKRDLGKLEIVVANAGIVPPAPFEATTYEQWRRIMTVNLDGTFLTVKAALPHLKEAGWGRIVVVSSSAVWLGVPGMAAYVASKMGLIGLVRSLAAELGEHGITVNAMTPGLTETPGVLATSVGEQFDWVVAGQAVKRRGRPEDLVSTLLYLCDERSGFITGQAINVDGGLVKH